MATRARAPNWKPPVVLDRVIEQWLSWVTEQLREDSKIRASKTFDQQLHDHLTRRPDRAADPCMAAIVAAESDKHTAVMALHLVLAGYPLPFRIVLVGRALGHTQNEMAEAIGIPQQKVGTVLRLAYAQLEQTVRMLAFASSASKRR